MADLNSEKKNQIATLFSMFHELIPMENLKYVNSWIESLFSGKFPAVPLARKLKYFIINWGTLTQDQNILSIVKGYKTPFLKSPVQQNQPIEAYFSQSQQQTKFRKC